MIHGHKSSGPTPWEDLEDPHQLLQESQLEEQVYQVVDLSPPTQSVDQVDLRTNNDPYLSATIVHPAALHVHLHRHYHATASTADQKEIALGYSGFTFQENNIIAGRTSYKLQL